jgi:hypothetical protein
MYMLHGPLYKALKIYVMVVVLVNKNIKYTVIFSYLIC